ncbi:MAG: ATPase [Tepidisphaera sp.]|nr:ATPase [Tepidisphaera sp.]
MLSNGLKVLTPTDTTIVLTRDFSAPRRLVWEAMFTPDKMRRWMLPPPGWTLSVCECDARVGGVLRVAWRSDDADPAMTLQGTFTSVEHLAQATHTETMVAGGWLGSGKVVGSLVEMHEFAERDGVTSMRITQRYESKDARDGALASGMDEGMEACYKQLDEVLSKPA